MSVGIITGRRKTWPTFTLPWRQKEKVGQENKRKPRKHMPIELRRMTWPVERDTAMNQQAVADNVPLLIQDTFGAALAGVSRAHWHRLRAAGKLPACIKLGRAVRWRRADVEQWIEWGCPDRAEFDARKAAVGRRVKVS
jgi:predicted DNA-binding transcriptional regulator AlpA